jgi:ADP-heptose:LPS heptosyltransferase
MGDVAMTVPVLKKLLDTYPYLHLTVASNAFFEPFFTLLKRCHFVPVYTRAQHKGVAGIFRLYKELKSSQHFDAVADLHGLLRSSILRSLFAATGVPHATINKGRKEKKQLTRKNNKKKLQLATGFDRYADVFAKLGFPVTLANTSTPLFAALDIPPKAKPYFAGEAPIVGVAPFAQHSGKMYPLDKMKEAVSMLSQMGYTTLLFGSSGEETITLQHWEAELGKQVFCMAGKFSLSEEMAIISRLNLMLTMDSANMHIASLFGVRVVSIWGATHPFAGFYGWQQQPNYVISKNMDCSPCSVFGNKNCWRGDHACMNQIAPEEIIAKLLQVKNTLPSQSFAIAY